MKTLLFTLILAALTGCAVTPSTIVQETRSARPPLAEVAPPSDGAIYNAARYRPMFEDRRARQIGDLLTINIVEKTSANKAGTSSGNKSGSANFALPGPLQSKLGANVGTEGGIKFADGDNQSASNAFTEVLSNGNLIVAGEKQVAMNKGIEFIRFSGMVSPDTIQNGNVVSSTVVADARVEYRTNSRIDRAEVNSMMSRFFQSLLPF
jgi:flagellar L-ring protein precursor FlgH